jgi:hypothetical protein
MATPWTVTFDCRSPSVVARFWATALGYEEPPAPAGFETWQDWFRDQGVPKAEWEDGAYLRDPEGVGPRLSFLAVPEPKIAKNRVHLDIQIGGGRSTPWEVRWPRVEREVHRLCEAGARVVQECELGGKPDHVVMADPEGNEFCVL